MTKKDLEVFKKKLEAEKRELEGELSGISEKDPSSPNGWHATAKGMEVDMADENVVADKLEEFEENSGIAEQLENQLAEVNAAIKRISDGTYGTCEVCGKPIEQERLEAYPAARISIKHAHAATAKA